MVDTQTNEYRKKNIFTKGITVILIVDLSIVTINDIFPFNK